MTAGANAGLDYIYLKIDEVPVYGIYTDYCQQAGYTRNYIVGLPEGSTSKQTFYLHSDDREVFTEQVDIITFADLGLKGTDWVTSIEDNAYNYDGKSETNSVIFKFGWEPRELTGNGWQLSLDSYWNSKCIVWFRSDGIFTNFGYENYKKFDPITSGKHEVEFGRIRVTEGPNVGKDYVYLKIDGTVIDSTYTNYYQTEGGYWNGYYDDQEETIPTIISPAYKISLPSEELTKQGFSGFGTDVQGDLDGNGTVDVNDLAILRRILIDEADTSTLADFDEDGDVDVCDLIAMKKHVS